jgi:hypothetical protein
MDDQHVTTVADHFRSRLKVDDSDAGTRARRTFIRALRALPEPDQIVVGADGEDTNRLRAGSRRRQTGGDVGFSRRRRGVQDRAPEQIPVGPPHVRRKWNGVHLIAFRGARATRPAGSSSSQTDPTSRCGAPSARRLRTSPTPRTRLRVRSRQELGAALPSRRRLHVRPGFFGGSRRRESRERKP